MNKAEELMRAYSELVALKENVPRELYQIDEDYVDEYNKALDHLSQLNYDVQEFRIPAEWLKPDTWQVLDGDGYETRHGSTRRVELAKFLVKLDSVLKYFSLSAQASPPDRPSIGFTGRKK
jgi:hypothetical protein